MPVTLVAHGYGNRRPLIAKAIAAGVDFIEADLRYERGRIDIRHEKRVDGLPLLYNWRLAKTHRRGPWALTVGPWFLRLDVAPMELEELVRRVAAEHGPGTASFDRAEALSLRPGLVLDLKRGDYSKVDALRFIHKTLATMDDAGFSGPVEFVGSWALLDAVQAAAPHATTRYSVDSERDWEALQPRIDAVRQISLQYKLLSPERGRFLRDRGIDFFCWDVYTAVEAEDAVALGASGIIARLGVLRRVRQAVGGAA